jgi:hypothetical protein
VRCSCLARRLKFTTHAFSLRAVHRMQRWLAACLDSVASVSIENASKSRPSTLRRRTAVRGTEPFLCAGAPLTTGASCTLFSWFARPGDGGPGEPLCPVLTHMASDHGARLTRTAPPSLPRFTHHTGSRACHTDAEPALRGAEQPHVLKLPPAQQLFFAHPHLPPWSRVWTTTS